MSDLHAIPEALPRRRSRLARELAVHDWLVLGYHTLIFCFALSGAGPLYRHSIEKSAAILFFSAAGIVAHRAGLLVGERFGVLVYRLAVYGGVQISYFALRDILPTFAPYTYDEALYRLDLALFGFEPSLSWQRFVSPATTEYFAFFYWGYYPLLAAYVLPMLFYPRDQARFADFALSMLLVFCASHLLYFAVPGFGPVRHLAHVYEHDLSGGVFYRWVIETVTTGGAQKDIFPSLHTAGPSTIALFAFRHRAVSPYRWVWLPTSLFVANIIVATMFLRWHYLVDVIAGLCLAGLVAVVAPRITAWETRRRDTPAWASLWGSYR